MMMTFSIHEGDLHDGDGDDEDGVWLGNLPPFLIFRMYGDDENYREMMQTKFIRVKKCLCTFQLKVDVDDDDND